MENIQLTTECLKAINSWGYTTYQNVCNGSMNVVEWGSLDYIGIVFVSLFGILVVAMFLRMIFDY